MSFLISLLSPVLLTLLKPVVQCLTNMVMEWLKTKISTDKLKTAAGIAVLVTEEASANLKKTTGTSMTPEQKLQAAHTTVAIMTNENESAITIPYINAALAQTSGAGATGLDTFSPKE